MQLEPGVHFSLDARHQRVELSALGRRRLEQEAGPLGALWQGRLRREHLVSQALCASHLLRRDAHYLVQDDGRIVMIDDEHPALVLQRPFPIVGGSSAYIPRGPVVDPNRLTDGGEAAADRVNALANWLVDAGVAVVATDAEVPATDVVYGTRLGRAGFHPIAEIQPSRHRVSLALAAGTDDDALSRND